MNNANQTFLQEKVSETYLIKGCSKAEETDRLSVYESTVGGR